MKRLTFLCVLLLVLDLRVWALAAPAVPPAEAAQHSLSCRIELYREGAYPCYLATLLRMDDKDVPQEQILLLLPHALGFQVMEKDELQLRAQQATERIEGHRAFVHAEGTEVEYALTTEEKLPEDSDSAYPMLRYSKYHRHPQSYSGAGFTIDGLYMGKARLDGVEYLKLQVETANAAKFTILVQLHGTVHLEPDLRLTLQAQARGMRLYEGRDRAVFEHVRDTAIETAK